MSKEVISDKQGISIVILFLIGSSSVFAMGIQAEQDLWIAIILAVIISIPFAALCARLHYLFPQKNVFDILEICFGKYIGGLFIIFFTLFNIYFSSYVLDSYGYFINTVTLPETPRMIPVIFIMFLCMFMIKDGLENLGRWSEFFIIIPIAIALFGTLALIPHMDIDNVKPILSNGLHPVLKGVFSLIGFPFCQFFWTIAVAFSDFKNKNSPYKIYISGLIIAGFMLLIASLTDLLVLGVQSSKDLYYPSYVVFQKVNIGNFIQRLEVILATTFVLGGFVKISISLLCACKGFAKIFKIEDYRFIVVPISLLACNLSFFLYEDIHSFIYFTSNIWPYLLFPIQIVFPIITLIVAEFKEGILKSKM